MFANLTESIKRRFILELRDYWSTEPQYKDSLVPNIQGRYSFQERPQQAIIMKGASASPNSFSADHYMGTVVSYCHLAKVYGKNGTSIEWIKEDSVSIQNNGGDFPSLPGIYYIEVLEEDVVWRGETRNKLVFYVDPLLDSIDERPIQLTPTEYEVGSGSFHKGSLRVFEMPGNIPLYEGVNYMCEPSTGRIELFSALPPNTYLSLDYRYASTSLGPFILEENGSNNKAIPGVVLAFGRRAYAGDIMAVVVSSRREDSSREYGGKWEMSLDFDIMARDVYASAEIADRTTMFLYTVLRDRLSFEGIEITNVSHGGEAEETYDENGDDYFYTASISVDVTTDWFMHLPLSRYLARVLPNTVGSDKNFAALDNNQIAETGSPTTLFLTQSLRLLELQDPWFRNRTKDFEMIR